MAVSPEAARVLRPKSVRVLNPESSAPTRRLDGLRGLLFPRNFDSSRSDGLSFQKCRMPLYEFRCPEGHDFEKFYRSIGTAATEEKCPVCGETASRLMSAAGLVFKGSGFYIT